MTRYWKPILDGRLRKEAREATEELIAASRRELPPGSSDREIGLGSGLGGMALFRAYSAIASGTASDLEEAEMLFDQTLSATSRVASGPSLYSGFVGAGWLLHHLNPSVEPSDAEDLDQVLRTILASRWAGPYDLVNGLVGIGVYAVSRLPLREAHDIAERVIERLAELTSPDSDERSWLTAPVWAPKHRADRYPDGFYDLGMAHGVAGVIAFLAAAHRADVSRPRAERLLVGAVDWLLERGLGRASAGEFPAYFAAGRDSVPTRAAWCYGDPGVAMALLAASRALENAALGDRALEVARRAARRSKNASGVVDACLCHGTAGLAHIYSSLFHETNEELFRTTAVEWFERTLTMRRSGAATAPFVTYRRRADGSVVTYAAPGLLDGFAGIGLALLAATTDVPPNWDSLLLLSEPAPAPVTDAEYAN